MINSLKFILFFILIFVILTGCSGGSDESTVTEDEEIVFIEPEDDYEELEFEDTTNYETGYEIEPNDNTAEAQTIQSGVSYIGGYHGAYSDYDYYSFEPESGNISINFGHINQYDPSSDWDISMAANGGWHSFCYKRTEQRRNLLCEFDIPYQFFNPREYFFVVFCRIRHFLLYQMSINLGKLFRQI